MVRTIGTRWPKRPRYDYPAPCDICGVPWPRSKMVQSQDGLLLCPQDRGRTVGELDRRNAEAAKRQRVIDLPQDRAYGGSSIGLKAWKTILPTSSGYSTGLTGYWELGQSDLVTQGGKVTKILDASGSGNHLSAGEIAPGYTSGFNGVHEALRFTASGEYLEKVNYDSEQPCTYLTLLYVERFTHGPDSHIVDGATGNRQLFHWQNESDTAFPPRSLSVYAGTNVVLSGFTMRKGMYAAIAVVFNGEGGGRVELNGQTSYLTKDPGSSRRGGIRVGRDNSTNQGLFAQIRALAVIERVVPEQDTADLLNGFLARADLPTFREPWL